MPKTHSFAAALPANLQEQADALDRAAMLPIVRAWPEDQTYLSAEPVLAIARLLIPVLHPHLEAARCCYLFKEEMHKGEKVRLGTASKASAKIAFLTDYDFILDFNWTAWLDLSREQRIALVDHELSHCGFDLEKGWHLIQHDVEEFGSIIRRWGLWTPDLLRFGRDMHEAMGQTDLFRGLRDVLEQSEGLESVTISSGGRSVRLEKE